MSNFKRNSTPATPRPLSNWLLISAVASLAWLALQAQAETLSGQHWQTESDNKKFLVTLDARQEVIPLRAFQQWVIQVTTRDGKPVHPVRFAIAGGMPAHGHGLPSQPRVTKHLGDGRYLISGVQFNMAGEWVMVFDIETASAADRATIAFTIDF